jgi:hypothetical protein
MILEDTLGNNLEAAVDMKMRNRLAAQDRGRHGLHVVIFSRSSNVLARVGVFCSDPVPAVGPVTARAADRPFGLPFALSWHGAWRRSCL